MSDSSEDSSSHEKGNSLYAALARTATRSVALYFSRPVRLFRPSKGALAWGYNPSSSFQILARQSVVGIL